MPTFDDKAQSILNEEIAKKGNEINLSIAKPKMYSNKLSNVERYMSYGTETFGKLGFNPLDNKENEETYMKGTSGYDDLGRAWKGMWKLAGVGFQDTFALGAFSQEDNANTFEDIMSKYSSNRKDMSGFWSNTLLSSGYTAGILLGVAAEELALGLLTGGAGNIATGAVVGSQLGRTTQRVNELGNVIESLNDVNNARKWYQSTTAKSIGEFGKSILNPLSETTDFIRNADKFTDLQGMRKVWAGAGAAVRDARKINMTLSESKLEADMKRNEYRTKLIDDHYARGGSELTEEQLKGIDYSADKVWNDVYLSNTGLIWATNAITFDNMFKSMRLSNKLFNTNLDGTFRRVGTGANTTIEAITQTALRKNLITPIKNKIKQITLPGTIKSTIGASMEGFQEVGQDIIGEGSGKYREDLYYGGSRAAKAKQGGYFGYLYDNARFDGEAFASGMLMGTLVAPVSIGTSLLNQYTIGSKGAELRERLNDPQAYAKKQEKINLDLKAKAKLLTEVFQKAGSFIEHSKKPVVMQAKLQEEILKAATENNRKVFEDKKAESFRLAVQTMLESGIESDFIQHLEYMGKNLNAEELNQVFGRTDITEANKSEYANKLLTKANEVKEHKLVYDKVQDEFINPFRKPSSSSDPNYLDYEAFEELKKEVIFNHRSISDLSKRMKDIIETAGTDAVTFGNLTDEKQLSAKIQALRISTEAAKDLTLSQEQKEQLEKDKKALDGLLKYEKALTNFQKESSKKRINKKKLEQAKNDLFIAFDDYMNPDNPVGVPTETDVQNFLSYLDADIDIADVGSLSEFRDTYLARFPELIRGRSKESFEKVYDYLTLNEEQKALKDYASLLSDPMKRSNVLKEIKAEFEKIDKYKESHIYESLKAFEESKATEKLINDLLEAGYFFDMSELDDLLDKGIMPTNIYNADTRQPVNKEERKQVQSILESFYTNLTGKKINYTRKYNQRNKSKNDTRTLLDLLDEYEIALNEEVDVKKLIKDLKSSPFLTKMERGLLNFLENEVEGSIIFVEDAESAVKVEEGVITVDIRNSAFDYKEGTLPFETLVVSALLQKYATERINEDSAFKEEVELLMKKAKENLKDIPETSDVLNNPVDFLTESLNNLVFQNQLKKIKDEDSIDDTDLWTELKDELKTQLRSKNLDKTVLKRAYALLNLSYVKADEEVEQEEEISDQAELSTEPVQLETHALLTARKKELLQKRNNLKEELSKASFFKKKGLSAELNKVNIEIIELEKKLKNMTEPVIEEVVEEVVEEIELTTPSDVIEFSNLPKELQLKLAEYLEVDVKDITTDLYRTDADAIKLISEYFIEQEKGEQPVAEDEDFEQEDVEEVVTDRDFIKSFFPKLDLSLVPEEELPNLVSKLKLRTMEATKEVLDYIVKLNSKEVIQSKAQDQLDLFSLDNYEYLRKQKGVIVYYNPFDRGRRTRIPYTQKDLAFLIANYPEIFSLEKGFFLERLRYIYRSINTAKKQIRLKSFELPTNQSDRNELILKEALEYMKTYSSMMSASMVTALNKKLNVNGVPFLFRRSGNTYIVKPRYKRKQVERETYAKRVQQVLENLGVDVSIPTSTIRSEEQAFVYAAWFFLDNSVKIDPETFKRRKKYPQKSMFYSPNGISMDAATDKIFDAGFNELAQSVSFNFSTIIQSIVENYTTKEELIKYVESFVPEVEEEEEDYEERERYERNLLNALLAEEQAKEYNEFLNTRLGLIQAGIYSEGWDGIENVTEAKAFEQAIKDGVYNEDGSVITEETRKEEPKKEEKKKESFAPEKKTLEHYQLAEELLKEAQELNLKGTDSYKLFNVLVKKLDKTNDVNFLINALKASELMKFSPKQEVILNRDFLSRLGYIAETLGTINVALKNGQVVSIVGVNLEKGLINISDEKGVLYNAIPNDFVYEIEKVLLNGEPYLKNDADTVVNEQENAYIKTTYNEIFANFTQSVNEYDKLENDQLIAKLAEQLSKCK